MSGARRQVELHTDGACSGNPGKGGYGVVLKSGTHRKELSGGFRLTTNNRMELMAAIVGLEQLKFPCKVDLFSDSEYVVKGFTEGRVMRWRDKGWKRDRNKPVVNVDSWQRLLALVEKHEVAFHWVRGHSGDPENERCDELAVAAYQSGELGIDAEYEATHGPPPA
jgi:ribonuclease HI